MSDMSRIVTVFGASGAQGGGVARALLDRGTWKVRAVTRKVDSAAAQALLARGAEVVYADLDEPDTITKAVHGSYAVFGVTDYWQHVTVHGNVEAGNIEMRQGICMVDALARLDGLQHFIWSTLPAAPAVPHLHSKNMVDRYIAECHPKLLARTTFLRVAWYAENLAWHEFFKPQKYGSGNQNIFIQPCAPTTPIPMAGNVRKNTGAFVQAILTHPEKSLPAKTATVTLSFALTYPQLLERWSDITGKRVVYLRCSKEDFNALYPNAGLELGLQYEFMEAQADMFTDDADIVTSSELEITDLVGIEETLEELKDSWP